MRTYPSSPDDDKIVPVKFHETRQTVQLWSENLDIICTSKRDAPVASLKTKSKIIFDTFHVYIVFYIYGNEEMLQIYKSLEAIARIWYERPTFGENEMSWTGSKTFIDSVFVHFPLPATLYSNKNTRELLLPTFSSSLPAWIMVCL